MTFQWLGALRHGESVGNVAADQAEATGAEMVDIEVPDHLVPLTERGAIQAAEAARWLAGQPAGSRPDVVVSSPYQRAMDTAQVVASELGCPVAIDERLRDRELGVLDRLTRRGVAARWPAEAARRAYLGRFYHRPPGGESWADVALRLRASLVDLDAEYPRRRPLLVTHEAVVYLCRYVIEGLAVAELEELARRPLANVGLTSWREHRDRLRLAGFDDTATAQTIATRQEHV
jgi:broad specificity phosphatase PhoE